MTTNPIYIELANITYWFFTFLSFEIIFSFFYIVQNTTIRSRSTQRFSGTTRFMVVFLLIGTILYLSDRFLSDSAKSFLSDLENTLIPLSVLSVSFDAFYAVKVIVGRGWTFPDVLITMCISIIAFSIAIFMISNGNKLL